MHHRAQRGQSRPPPREHIVARSVLHLTNQERYRVGLSALEGHSALIKASSKHSRWMARTGRYNHTGYKGSRPADRIASAGYYGATGENIWKGTSDRRDEWEIGRACVQAFMDSPGHRANILNRIYRHIGIGIAVDRKGSVYITQNFGKGGSIGRALLRTILPFPF